LQFSFSGYFLHCITSTISSQLRKFHFQKYFLSVFSFWDFFEMLNIANKNFKQPNQAVSEMFLKK